MTRKYLWVLACFGCSFNVYAASNIEQKVIQAIADIADAPRKEWAVQVANYENEEGDVTSSVERYAPNEDKTKQWTLLTINEQTPTKRQLKKYLKDKRKQAKDKAEGKSLSINLKTLIKQDTLKLIADEGTHAELGFDVHMPKLGDDAVGKLTGTLIYSKQNDYIEVVNVVNKEAFSPMFSASISQLKVSLNFVKLDKVVLPQQYQMQMKGTFAYFTQIDEQSTTTFSDYQHKSNL